MNRQDKKQQVNNMPLSLDKKVITRLCMKGAFETLLKGLDMQLFNMEQRGKILI